MRLLAAALLVLGLLSCESEADKIYKQGIVSERAQKNQDFAMTGSPLDSAGRLNFSGLKYFPIEKSFKAIGQLQPFARPEPVILEQGDTVKRMLKYAEASFDLKGGSYTLLVYKSMPNPLLTDQNDELFIPFFDATNGSETYEGGRYIYPVINEEGDLELDFNLASNPYCAYNHKYNCVVPPLSNTLDVEIKAGEKRLH